MPRTETELYISLEREVELASRYSGQDNRPIAHGIAAVAFAIVIGSRHVARAIRGEADPGIGLPAKD